MVASRQDAWTEDDDLVLAEVTLRHIREGGTQLAAFEEVGQRLGRTAAACGFRWNSCVRKRYDAAISIAKSQRQQLKKMGRIQTPATTVETEAVLLPQRQLPPAVAEMQASELESVEEEQIESVIRMLVNQKEMARRLRQLEQELEGKDLELKEWKDAHERAKKELEQVQGVNDDYRALVQIMDRARKLAFLQEEESSKAIFKMDENGNLERVEK
ncbi:MULTISPECIES: RsfA family transcriptional regulator [Brevibacillus]|uniref:RsfA family transcriptional regulator n=1 Tax=Brevibacillus TaxID=55080 RepID=UPI0007AB91E6|nr:MULTISPECIES: RsfA family transcriptional regulator [Brevibacillus]KZE47436.1 precorrin-3B C(17)-methyltransferase [Brevibacillus parabrevis]UED67251.1 RsfA family transcriptional regulator [Brevibacillus sp. HD3.3A]